MVKLINGAMLRDMVVGAATLLDNHKEALNALNVFPVPDGDTGTNMSLTMISAAKEVNAANISDYKDVITALSVGSLKGARGNSGVILSQIWRGFSAVLIELKGEINAFDIARALQKGTECAYKAIMKPKEGTILTVARAMADAAVAFAQHNDNIPELLKHVLSEGETVLKRTPDMLPVLKEAGVVDAGGAGLIIIFRGFKMVLEGEEINVTIPLNLEAEIASGPMDAVSSVTGDIEFGYCTEFFIKNIRSNILERDVDSFRHTLSKLGDCVLVVGDLKLIKVHVHTNDPGIVLQTALTLGELSKIKIDNMREQHREIAEDPAPQNLKPISVVSVVSGEGLKDIFRDSLVEEFVDGGQTMNPSTQDILSAIGKAPSNNIIVLPNNKNIILAAQQAADLSQKTVTVIPTTTLPQGIGSALSFNCEEDYDTNVKRMQRALSGVKSGQVTVAVRDSGINGNKIKKGDWIGIAEDEIVANGGNIKDVSLRLLDKLVDEDTGIIAVYYGEGVEEQAAESLLDAVEEKFEDCDVELHFGGQTVYNYLFAVE